MLFCGSKVPPTSLPQEPQTSGGSGIPRDPENIKTKFDRGATSFLVHKIVEVQGKYTCAFFVSATDDAKKCTTITAHVHWKCAVISVYFFASGKARLPKPPPSTGDLPSAYAFQTYAGILVIVCSAGLAGA